MSSSHAPDSMQRLLEMLADEAIGVLDDADRQEFAELSQRHPEVDGDEFERIAASLLVATLPADREPMPEHVHQSLHQLMERWPLETTTTVRPLPTQPSVPVSMAPPARRTSTGMALQPSLPDERAMRMRLGAWSGWIAAAACLTVAVLIGLPRGGNTVDPSAAFSQLAARDGTIRLAWTATGDEYAPDASGEVLWCNTSQDGYMRFVNLTPNDPQEYQYQLWVFDATRNEQYPVNGGVFDVNDRGEALVPIKCELKIDEPMLFAVTVERPGGVARSEREHIVVVAQVPGA